jgi:hypothetical protein
MAKERVQKPTGQPSSQNKLSRIVPPLIDGQTKVDSLPSPKVPVSGMKSKAERDAIRRNLFEKWARATPQSEPVQVSQSAVLGLYRRPLYRGMTDDGKKPKIGDSARNLGVRQEEITVQQRDGKNFIIANDKEGMSTAPDTPRNLPEHRRNKDWGGKGKDPVWEIDDSKVTGALKAFQDKPTHVTVAASQDMLLEDFKAALSNTQNNWQKALPPS